MTIPTTTNRSGPYLGNDVTTTFNYAYRILDQSHLVVKTLNTTTGVETTLAITTGYTVAGVGQDTGSITLVAGPLATGLSLTILRVVPVTQADDYKNQSTFHRERHEETYDYCRMVDQQMKDDIGRSFKLPDTEAGTAANTVLPAAVTRANKLFGFDASGNPIATSTLSGVGSAIPFVTIGNDATLSAERALTGTANQVVITDNGANSTVVLSLPQSIALTSDVEFRSVQLGTGSGAAVSAAGKGRIRFNEGTNLLQVSLNGAAYVDVVTGSGGLGTLDQAYDFGGAGSGRTITVDSGPVQLTGSGTPGTQGHLVLNGSQTKASAAGARWDALDIDTDITLSGSTSITTGSGFNMVTFRQPTITAGSALTITHAATLRIDSSPLAGGSVTITNAYGLWMNGAARLDSSLFVAAPAADFTGITGSFFAVGSALRTGLFTGTKEVARVSNLSSNTEGIFVVDCDTATGSAAAAVWVIQNPSAGIDPTAGTHFLETRADSTGAWITAGLPDGALNISTTTPSPLQDASQNFYVGLTNRTTFADDRRVLWLVGAVAGVLYRNAVIGDTTVSSGAVHYDTAQLNVVQATNQLRLLRSGTRYSTFSTEATNLNIVSVVDAGTFTYTFPVVTGTVAVSGSSPSFVSPVATTSLSIGTNPAATGALRVANNSALNWRNAANSADIEGLVVNASNQVSLGVAGNPAVLIAGATGTLGFFGLATPIVKQTSGANLTNNVTAGGVNDQIDNWTDLATYATDAAAIRNAAHQLARKLKQVNDALRAYGLLT